MTMTEYHQVWVWGGIFLCLTQSAMFSGLNLAFFGISRLRLEVEAAGGNENAKKVLRLRKNTNFLLCTILWGNVGINVLLTLLSESVLAGVSAFFFSTFAITFFGEIAPQAYFSRNALRMAALLSPLLRVYQVLLFPLARPTSMALDWWLGKEGIQFYQESELRKMIQKHVEDKDSDIDWVEGMGALNFLTIDDIFIANEGEPVDPKSCIPVPTRDGVPYLSRFTAESDADFLRAVDASGQKWVLLLDSGGYPEFVLDADGFLRNAFFRQSGARLRAFCHRPVIVTDPALQLGEAMRRLKVKSPHPSDDVIDQDVILLWSEEKRIITGSDILGRLLRGIVPHQVQPG
jgi:hypothetical protein